MSQLSQPAGSSNSHRIAHMLLALMCLLPLAKAYANNVLEECIALSPQMNDIHICLDNYLDDMDQNIARNYRGSRE